MASRIRLDVCLSASMLVSISLVLANAAAPSLPYSRSLQSRRTRGWPPGGPFDAHTLHSGTPFISRERQHVRSPFATSKAVLLTSSPKKRRWGRRKKETEPEPDLDDIEDEGKEPSIEEMYASLGLFGRTMVGAVDVALVTVTSYLSGALLGYFGGGLFGVSALFRNSNAPPPGAESGMRVVDPNSSFLKEARGRLGNWNSKALSTGKSWGELSAAFSGFHALARVARGNVEDKWNSVLGSACTGAYMSRKGGPNAMVQGAATYASFTYLLDVFFGTGGSKRRQLPDGTMVDDQFEFKDEPVY